MHLVMNEFESSGLRVACCHLVVARDIEDGVLNISLAFLTFGCEIDESTVFAFKPEPFRLLLALSGLEVPLSGVLMVVE
jgi:hypothetical protein